VRELLTSPVNTTGRTVTDSEIEARRTAVSLDQAANRHRALGTSAAALSMGIKR
jgi:hypothetical protein